VLAERGLEPHPGAAAPILADLLRVLADVPIERAGTRLRGMHGLNAHLEGRGGVGAVAAEHLGATARPVPALLFDKPAANNWSLGWHQDRTIAVAERRDVNGFGPLTIKRDMVHVEPPPALQAGMITLRVHLDRVDPTNAPLLAAAGSHAFGRIRQPDIGRLVERCEIVRCTADAGDI
jgi:hypothetical protein